MSMKVQDHHLRAAVGSLLRHGFRPQDQGGAPRGDRPDGMPRTLSGRARLIVPGTTLRASVGVRTMALYRTDGKGIAGVTIVANIDTGDGETLSRTLSDLGLFEIGSHVGPVAAMA